MRKCERKGVRCVAPDTLKYLEGKEKAFLDAIEEFDNVGENV